MLSINVEMLSFKDVLQPCSQKLLFTASEDQRSLKMENNRKSIKKRIQIKEINMPENLTLFN